MADDDPTATDAQFKSMTDTLLTNDAQDVLESQLRLARKWREKRVKAGKTPELADFIRSLVKQPLFKRNQVLAAFGAAMWRLIEADDAS